jgi:DNA-binding response OmpR family regulator
VSYAIHALLVEDSDADAGLLRALMQKTEQARFGVTRATWLKSALTLLENKTFDVVLLDMGLPDSQGVDSVVSIMQHAPGVPVVVLTGYEDLETAINAVRVGAQDYLLKTDITPSQLEWRIICSIERGRASRDAKKLMLESVAILRDGPVGSMRPPATGLIGEHVNAVEHAVAELRAYLLKNAPAHYEAGENILDANRYGVAMREMRDFLRLDVDRGRRTLTDIATDAVRAVSDPALEGADAEQAILEVLDDHNERAVRLGGQ